MAEPKIKFRQNDGSNYPDWETIPMSEVFTEISEKNHPELPVLSVQQGVGTILRDSSDRNILYDKKNLNGYKAMKKDDFIIHLRSFEGGLECSNYDGISSPAYRILRPNRILSGAYRDYFRSDDFIRNKLAVSVVGIRDGKNIDMDTFWQISITVPCIEEQQKIADFLGDVDALIKTSEQELLKLKELKKGCLQKMFPRGDADVPEVRFPGFTGAWERRILGEFVTFSKGSGYSKGDLKDDGTPIILYGRLYTKYETVISEVDTFAEVKKGSVFSKGGDVIVPASGETEEDISVASVVEKSGILLGSDLNVITPPDDLDSAFLAISISNGKPHKDMAKMAQGKSVVHLHNSDLAKIDLPYPSLEEQIRIRSFFSEIDNLIALHQRECEKYKELKKGLLQQMFV